ncbi:MAG: hypothetical protein GXP54_06855 [Deltaproteobacteria bacterium]|nr:hypothetical protein [Deltaproteobacteria bacterium]
MSGLFSNDRNRKVSDLLTSTWGNKLDDEIFKIKGRVEPGFVELSVSIEKRDRTFRYAMTFRAMLEENSIGVDEGLALVLDFLGHYLEQYFEADRELYLPLDFQSYEFGDHRVLARGDVTNPQLDEMADEIITRGVPLDDD